MSSSDEHKLYGVFSNSLGLVWDQVAPLISMALDHADDKYKLCDIWRALCLKEMQLWVVFAKGFIESFCITRIISYPQEKRASILFSSGRDVYAWIHLNKEIQMWAKENGCSYLEVYGRPGWEKLLAPYGYEKIHTVLKVKLPETH